MSWYLERIRPLLLDFAKAEANLDEFEDGATYKFPITHLLQYIVETWGIVNED